MIYKKNRVFITGGKGDIARAIKLTLDKYRIFNPGHKTFDVVNPDYGLLDKYHPDFIVNNAGHIDPALIGDYNFDMGYHFSVNTFAPIQLARWAMNHGCLGVVHIGSSSIDAKKGWGSYCASKMALLVLSETLSLEGFPSVVVSPARTNTKMRQRLYPGEDTFTLLEPLDIAVVVRNVLDDIERFDGKEVLIKCIDGMLRVVCRKRVYELEDI